MWYLKMKGSGKDMSTLKWMKGTAKTHEESVNRTTEWLKKNPVDPQKSVEEWKKTRVVDRNEVGRNRIPGKTGVDSVKYFYTRSGPINTSGYGKVVYLDYNLGVDKN